MGRVKILAVPLVSKQACHWSAQLLVVLRLQRQWRRLLQFSVPVTVARKSAEQRFYASAYVVAVSVTVCLIVCFHHHHHHHQQSCAARTRTWTWLYRQKTSVWIKADCLLKCIEDESEKYVFSAFDKSAGFQCPACVWCHMVVHGRQRIFSRLFWLYVYQTILPHMDLHVLAAKSLKFSVEHLMSKFYRMFNCIQCLPFENERWSKNRSPHAG